MALAFTQTVSVRRTGFGNSVLVTIGDPVPVGAESYDSYPYIDAGSVAKLTVTDGEGVTKTVYENPHDELAMWGIPGEQQEFEVEVGYDSTALFTWTLGNITFQEVDGVQNVAAEMEEPATAMFRMWGETESWGQGEKILYWPWQNVR